MNGKRIYFILNLRVLTVTYINSINTKDLKYLVFKFKLCPKLPMESNVEVQTHFYLFLFFKSSLRNKLFKNVFTPLTVNNFLLTLITVFICTAGSYIDFL